MKIAIVGLGYVGLPLAVCFAKKRPVVGFDIDPRRIEELRLGRDRTREIDASQLKAVLRENPFGSNDLEPGLDLTCNPSILSEAEVIIVTVPTPIDAHKKPDLGPLLAASRTIGKHLRPGTVVVYESTVYPGATEEDCVPVLESESGLKWRRDFHVGYSPERINPGDRQHTIDKILKVVSGDDEATAKALADLYASAIPAGVFIAASIKTAEAAKVIENSQRDINIAFVNELAIIFQRMGLDTASVLEAAGTKWNFLPFKPGLVGGHCIGVDPYYLTHKAEALGYHPQVILAGRRINDGMGAYIANRIIKQLISRNHLVRGARVLILGITFKENCPDIRNSRVIDIVAELKDFGAEIDVYDPWADPVEVFQEYEIELLQEDALASSIGRYAAVIHAVSHRDFLTVSWNSYAKPGGIVYDVKSVIERNQIDERL